MNEIELLKQRVTDLESQIAETVKIIKEQQRLSIAILLNTKMANELTSEEISELKKVNGIV